jgi:hypothetical protein
VPDTVLDEKRDRDRDKSFPQAEVAHEESLPSLLASAGSETLLAHPPKLAKTLPEAR